MESRCRRDGRKCSHDCFAAGTVGLVLRGGRVDVHDGCSERAGLRTGYFVVLQITQTAGRGRHQLLMMVCGTSRWMNRVKHCHSAVLQADDCVVVVLYVVLRLLLHTAHRGEQFQGSRAIVLGVRERNRHYIATGLQTRRQGKQTTALHTSYKKKEGNANENASTKHQLLTTSSAYLCRQ